MLAAEWHSFDTDIHHDLWIGRATSRLCEGDDVAPVEIEPPEDKDKGTNDGIENGKKGELSRP
jgi:hypothetical protein